MLTQGFDGQMSTRSADSIACRNSWGGFRLLNSFEMKPCNLRLALAPDEIFLKCEDALFGMDLCGDRLVAHRQQSNMHAVCLAEMARNLAQGLSISYAAGSFQV